MIHRSLLSTLTVLTVFACTNQAALNTPTADNSTTRKPVEKTPAKAAEPTRTSVPEMAPGLPPDKKAKEQAEKESSQNAAQMQSQVIYFNEGENKFLKEYEMNVTFKKLIEDSRCPEGVNCIWQGAATAEVELMGLATRPYTVRVSTISDTQKGYSKAADFNGYTITLANVTPTPTQSKGYKSLQGTYKIGLRISKDTDYGNAATTR